MYKSNTRTIGTRGSFTAIENILNFVEERIYTSADEIQNYKESYSEARATDTDNPNAGRFELEYMKEEEAKNRTYEAIYNLIYENMGKLVKS